MTKLTKAYFDRRFDKLELQNRDLARAVKIGFDGVDEQLTDIIKMLDVRKDVEELKLQMKDIRQALALNSKPAK